jgi:hypothetical protein
VLQPQAAQAGQEVHPCTPAPIAPLLALIVIILLLTSTPDTPAIHSAGINHWYTTQPVPGDTAMPDQPTLF